MSDLLLSNVEKGLIENKEYGRMLNRIQNKLPDIIKNSQNFYKSSSQYKDVTLNVTDLTPMSSLKHILAVIEQTRTALEDAYFDQRKNEITLKKKQMEFNVMEEGCDKDLLEIEIDELYCKNKNSQNYIKGAIRKLNFFVTQYESILKNKIGKESITEEDFEKEENRFHIMTALKQALNASRTRGGIIDEGNHIYLFEMGINGAVAQQEILNYLNMEQQLLNEGKEPTHEMTIKWLEACAEKFANCGKKFAESRGLLSFDIKSLNGGNDENN